MPFYDNIPRVFVNRLSKSTKIKNFIEENGFNLPGFKKDLQVIQTFFQAFTGKDATGKILKPSMSDFKIIHSREIIKAVISNHINIVFPDISFGNKLWYDVREIRDYIRTRADKALRLASRKANGTFIYNVTPFLPTSSRRSPFFCSYFSYDSGILYDFNNYGWNNYSIVEFTTTVTMRFSPPSRECMLGLSTGYGTRVKITESDIKQFLANNPGAFDDYIDLIEDVPFDIDNVFDVEGLNIPQSTYDAIDNIKLPRNREIVTAIYETLAKSYDLFKIKPTIQFSSNGFVLRRTQLKHSVINIFKMFEQVLNSYGVKNKNIGSSISTFPGGADAIHYQSNRRGIDFSWSSVFDPRDKYYSEVTVKFSFK